LGLAISTGDCPVVISTCGEQALMMDILFKSPAGIASIFTFAFLLLMGFGLWWWFMHKMKQSDDSKKD
jgi:hypothetical protein